MSTPKKQRKRDSGIPPAELHLFVNGLRAALGLGPLYDMEKQRAREASTYFEQYTLPMDGAEQDWVQARDSSSHETRNERWGRQIDLQVKRRERSVRIGAPLRDVNYRLNPGKPGPKVDFKKRVRQ